jgi:hypothetical protein
MRVALWTAAVLLLAIPLIAMQYTDFAFAMIMIGGVGGAYELALRLKPNWAYRAGVAMALAAAFLLIWINAAVGIIGDEGNPWNLMFAGAILVAVAGSVIARVRAAGMVWAMVAAALTQCLAGAVAIVGGLGEPVTGALELAGLVGFFGVLWLNAAWLFRRAANAKQKPRK